MRRNSAYVQLQWACSIIGAILVTINPAYKVHELVNRLLASKVSILKPGAADGDVEPRRDFALVPGSEHPIVEISEPIGRSMSRDLQLTER
jgi:acyl-CoA synthetase (AMP-forming)/AMP-acid ligase II